MGSAAADTPDAFLPAIGDDFAEGLAEDLRARVKAELEPGERLLWASRCQPPPARIGIGYYVAALYALAFLGFGVLAIRHALGSPRPESIRASELPTGIVCSLVGCLVVATMIAIRIFTLIERGRQARIVYGATDRRAIALIPNFERTAVLVRSMPWGYVRGLAREERPDGSGSLDFCTIEDWPDDLWHEPGFQNIPEVRLVEQIVQRILLTSETFMCTAIQSPSTTR